MSNSTQPWFRELQIGVTQHDKMKICRSIHRAGVLVGEIVSLPKMWQALQGDYKSDNIPTKIRELIDSPEMCLLLEYIHVATYYIPGAPWSTVLNDDEYTVHVQFDTDEQGIIVFITDVELTFSISLNVSQIPVDGEQVPGALLMIWDDKGIESDFTEPQYCSLMWEFDQ